MRILISFLIFSISTQVSLAQNRIFLAKKSDPLTIKPATTDGTITIKTVVPTVSSDNKLMAVRINETTIKGRTIKVRPLSLLFDLETGNVVKQFRNATLRFEANALLMTSFSDDIWDKTLHLSEYSNIRKNMMTYEYLNPTTFQENPAVDLPPKDHALISTQGIYLLTYKAEGKTPYTYLWRKKSTELVQVRKFPIVQGRISADGTVISGLTEGYGELAIYDIRTGNLLKRVSVKETPLGGQVTQSQLLIYAYMLTDNGKSPSYGVKILDLNTEKELAHFPDAGGNIYLNDSEETLLIHSSNTGKIKLIDMLDFSVTTIAHAFVSEDQPHTKKSGSVTVSTSESEISKVGMGEQFLIAHPSGVINLVSSSQKRIIADIYIDHEDWAVVAKDGRVDGTPGALDKLEWREYDSDGNVVNRTSLDDVFSNFFTPGLLPSLLRGEIGDNSELKEQMAKAPSVEIISPSDGTKTSEQQVAVTVKTTANGDPVKDIRLFVNGKLIAGGERGLKMVNDENQKTFNVLLVPGRNVISTRAISQNDYESSPDYLEIEYSGRQITSNLHILAIGINQYLNTSYNLNYAVADAGAIVDNMRARSAGIFGQTHIHTIYNQDATKERITETFRQIAQDSKPEDVFVFFYAGHGVMSEGVEKDFYLALHEVTQLYGKEDLLKSYGISAAELKTLTSDIKAQKQMIILDACQSGGAVETFAMRGAAEEKAIIQLARSTGVTLLASTGSEQYATEFEQLGHGVFTYAILEGLSGKADGGNRDKKITVKELEAWLNDMVPEMTQKYKGTVQYPRSWSQGMDFPIGVVNK